MEKITLKINKNSNNSMKDCADVYVENMINHKVYNLDSVNKSESKCTPTVDVTTAQQQMVIKCLNKLDVRIAYGISDCDCRTCVTKKGKKTYY